MLRCPGLRLSTTHTTPGGRGSHQHHQDVLSRSSRAFLRPALTAFTEGPAADRQLCVITAKGIRGEEGGPVGQSRELRCPTSEKELEELGRFRLEEIRGKRSQLAATEKAVVERRRTSCPPAPC